MVISKSGAVLVILSWDFELCRSYSIGKTIDVIFVIFSTVAHIGMSAVQKMEW